MVDVGLTHIALQCLDINRSAAFYAKYANMVIVHDRQEPDSGHRVVWLSDNTRPFVIVLIEAEKVEGRLGPIAHLGVGCPSRREIDRLCAEAKRHGVTVKGPEDWGYPVGYWAFLYDPDGHVLELSYGQEVGLTVQNANGDS